ncbi:SLAP domain-containing protein [Companilactobacillus insicii]|uniref:SLAP domain-containing protein n=1 Tax=Companilactobacillus insicii TaxID=1732567 RepID=UPI0013DDC2FC|nr:SLAP domain-containing protein [Companilactobacillus insicii]
MKKGILSSLIAAGIMVIGSLQPIQTVNAAIQTNGNISGLKGTVTTNKTAQIYALRGNELIRITNRALRSNTGWLFNKTTTGTDGLTYYRVATNEWVPSNSIKSNSSNNGNSVDEPTASRSLKTIYIGTWDAATVNYNGTRTGNILPAHSSWKAFADTVNINGQTYYQISSNEFISTFDTASSPTVGQNIDTSTTGKIVGNSASKKYHMPWQKNYKINSSNLVYFNSEQEAINMGYHKSKV